MITNIQFAKEISSINFVIEVTPFVLPDSIVIPDELRTVLEKTVTNNIKVSFFGDNNATPTHVHTQSVTIIKPLIDPIPSVPL